MSHKTDQDQLLAEVLAEASPADFRAALLSATLRQARRRRQFRVARQVVGVLAVLGLLAVFLGHQFSRPPVAPSTPAGTIAKSARPQAGYELVRTRPLPAAALVGTRKLSVPSRGWSLAPVTEVVTTRGGYRLLNDNELLAMLVGKPAVLIRTSPQTEELVFANAEDQKLLLKN